MTTRAGLSGVLTGLVSAGLIYFLFFVIPDFSLQGWLAGSPFRWVRIAAAGLVMLMLVGGGWLAARWSGSTHSARCAVLGALSGGLTGTLLFCLVGTAVSSSSMWYSSLGHMANGSTIQIEMLNAVILHTMETFLGLFLSGGLLGALGGRLTCLRKPIGVDHFDTYAPQMAMNASITAVPSSMLAVALAAYVFPRLTGFTSLGYLPMQVALLLLLLSQLALTLVIPHETHQAEHLSGLQEVKMAAYVDIAAAPLLILLLSVLLLNAFSKPLVLIALILSAGFSLVALFLLLKKVLPRRASLPTPLEGGLKAEAKWFGSIAHSRGSRLVVLCIGCGLAMVLPIYVTVLSMLINFNYLLTDPTPSQFPRGMPWGLFLSHTVGSLGLVAAAILVLSIIYIFYLNLGRWFSKKNLPFQK